MEHRCFTKFENHTPSLIEEEPYKDTKVQKGSRSTIYIQWYPGYVDECTNWACHGDLESTEIPKLLVTHAASI
ncbi:predicted protein [Lichtheimia corymbifera JMRC:FSU:9682]|uniref:Uncharacterized protein n=1 Tax=Lichtheimia corymbifera JMRC:FSU:9682 TaxID=1263082 RepID=A0A068RS51_9FUNG|nr:predicted protein [Lichtheimia corymbifera JMRC:FSU:9682]